MDGGDGDDLGVVRCGILIITRILMNDVNPEGGGEAARENTLGTFNKIAWPDLVVFSDVGEYEIA